MKLIIDYILNMLPYMLIAIPFFVIFRFIFLKIKKIKVNWYHEFAFIVLVMFLVGLASQTIIPKFEIRSDKIFIFNDRVHETNLILFKVLVDTYKEVFINGNFGYFLINFVGNIVMFIPIGFLILVLWNVLSKRVILIGFCLSLFIETCQLFLARGTDIDDLLLNTLGVLIGVLIYKYLYKKENKVLIKFRQ